VAAVGGLYKKLERDSTKRETIHKQYKNTQNTKTIQNQYKNNKTTQKQYTKQ
jgi:hypothetical protein